MKAILVSALWVFYSQVLPAQSPKAVPNIFIITTDGFRWQELFGGADPDLMASTTHVKDTALIRQLYGGGTAEIRRKNLLPFFWNTIASQGQLYGNRLYNNKADVKNFYKISYSGYNEIFTGYADPRLVPNTARNNTNTSLPGYLNSLPEYRGKVVAFTSWNIFPYILNETAHHFPVNSGYENAEATDELTAAINEVQDSVHNKKASRYDMLTFLMAKQHIQKEHPKVVVLAFGETDDFAHSGRYDIYLQKANDFDKMLGELWYQVQTDPFYRNNTSFIITTDHGRGRKNNTWSGHHSFVRGSGEIWLAMLGNGIAAKGEIKCPQQIYQNQIAQTIAGLMGKEFISLHDTGKPIDLSFTEKDKATEITHTGSLK